MQTKSEAILCPKCSGTGVYNGRYKCFACKGTGGQTKSDQMRNRVYWQHNGEVRATPPEVTKPNVTAVAVTSTSAIYELSCLAKKIAITKKLTVRVKAGEIEVLKKGGWTKPPKTWLALARVGA